MSESEKTEKAEKAAPLADAIDKAFAEDVDPQKKETDSDEDSNGSVKYGEEADISSKNDDDDDRDEDEKDEKESKEEKKSKADLFLPKGNPFRTKRGLIAILAGGLPAFLLMAKNGQNVWAYPLGLLFIAVAAFGVMDLLGTFDDPDEHVATKTTLDALKMPLGRTAALGVAFAGTLAASAHAFWPQWVAMFAVPASFIALVASVFDLGVTLGPWKTDELGLERPLFQRHGFWVFVVGAVLYLPTLGLFSLWDPWETHYGEVAREILARDDWVSLWWAQDGWFWSKPILNFWIQSLSMGTLGTHFRPDQMLIAWNGTAGAHPEWALRAPNVLMTLVAMYLLYKGVAKVFGRRAGLLGAIVLATMPDWFFLAHQTMTDMPFVAAMTGAMGLLLLGLNTEEDMRVKVYEVEAFGMRLRLSLWHLVFGAVLLCAIPQILYLLSRNIELVVFGDGPKGFRFHWDEFRKGSAGNCGLPGNENCHMENPASIPKAAGPHPEALGGMLLRFFGGFEPALQAIVWGAVIGGVLYVNWGERRARRLIYISAWLLAALATMAKGPAGFGLPIICAFAYVATKKRWSELLRFEMVSGLMVILAVALPWYVAMYVRHGSPFTDRLIFHDMFNRAFSHVHDTNEGDDTGIRFYLWQLGYALFPWTALAPLGLSYWLRKSDSAESYEGRGDAKAVGDASVMLFMWFLFAFALFTFMGTKFHHYIFPAVPPAAMLIGVVLDDMLGKHGLGDIKKILPNLALIAVGAALAVYGVSTLFPQTFMGDKVPPPSPMPVGWDPYTPKLTGAFAAFPVGLVAIFAGIFMGGSPSTKADDGEEDPDRRTHEHVMFGGAAFAGALLLLLVGRDLTGKPDSPDQPGAIRLLQLFTYNYKRPWPDSLDFNGALTGFTVVAAILVLLLGVRFIRRQAVAAFCTFAFVWALWGLDIYMMRLSPHWGQHEVIEAYYKDRANPEEQLIAYQMNWKGENIYTGNRIPAFVSSGQTFQTWLKGQKEKGAKVMYFVTEHSRTGGLRSEVGAKSYKEITDKALCNKFVLVRAEL